MSASPTIVAVDIDGVVNALPMSDADLAHFERWERRQVMGYPLTVAGEVVDWLTSLDDRGGEYHWASTWTPNRQLLEDAFGLPADAPIAADPGAPIPAAEPGVTWKGAQLAHLVAEQRRPLVWMDDDAITDATVTVLDDVARRLDLPMLLVPTRLPTGLLPEQMRRIDDFLVAVQDGTAAAGVELAPAAPPEPEEPHREGQ